MLFLPTAGTDPWISHKRAAKDMPHGQGCPSEDNIVKTFQNSFEWQVNMEQTRQKRDKILRQQPLFRPSFAVIIA